MGKTTLADRLPAVTPEVAARVIADISATCSNGEEGKAELAASALEFMKKQPNVVGAVMWLCHGKLPDSLGVAVADFTYRLLQAQFEVDLLEQLTTGPAEERGQSALPEEE